MPSNSSRPDPGRRACFALALAPWGVSAAPPGIEAFGIGTWAGLQAQVGAQRRPALVLFSATWCAICPQAILRLARDPRRLAARIPLWVVVADVAPGEDDARLLAAAHYRAADRLLAFDGSGAALRHAVDPRWRGVMPTVAWLAPGRAPVIVQGEPGTSELDRWLGPR